MSTRCTHHVNRQKTAVARVADATRTSAMKPQLHTFHAPNVRPHLTIKPLHAQITRQQHTLHTSGLPSPTILRSPTSLQSLSDQPQSSRVSLYAPPSKSQPQSKVAPHRSCTTTANTDPTHLFLYCAAGDKRDFSMKERNLLVVMMKMMEAAFMRDMR